MVISGFQKTTLLDFPGKVACTIFTYGCNFRCPFCHNAALVVRENEDIIPEDEILSFLKKRVGILDGVCITGGEPFLQKDIANFLREVKSLGYAVKLDTNGSFPDRLKSLINENLVDYVAIDIKNSPEKYGETIGLKNFDISPVKESVDFLLQNKIPYEFRTTVVKEYHNIDDMEKIGQFIFGADKYFLQEFNDSGDLIGEELGLSAYKKEVLEEMARKVAPFVKTVGIRGV
jgi:pyruvate formate lyase activating enzyme